MALDKHDGSFAVMGFYYKMRDEKFNFGNWNPDDWLVYSFKELYCRKMHRNRT